MTIEMKFSNKIQLVKKIFFAYSGSWTSLPLNAMLNFEDAIAYQSSISAN